MSAGPWSKPRVSRQRTGAAHGITFIKHERGGEHIRAEATMGAYKLHADGVACIELALNQDEHYRDELAAQIWTTADVVSAKRVSSQYSRIQIFLGPADLDTAMMLQRLAAFIYRRCNYGS